MARGDLKNLSRGVRAMALPAPDLPCMGNSVAWIFSLRILFLKLFFEISVRAEEILGPSRSNFLVQYLQSSHDLFDIPYMYAGVYCREG
jgi:hypothetical protein